MARLKRAYEEPRSDDGYRVLVDRIWPRGLKKADAAIDWWAKEIAPSTGLRKWFDHDPEKFPEFTERYRQELADSEGFTRLAELDAAKRVTLVYAAKDEEHNNAKVLQEMLEDVFV